MNTRKIIVFLSIIVLVFTQFTQTGFAESSFKVKYHVYPLYLEGDGGYVTLTVTIKNTGCIISGKDVVIETEDPFERHWKTFQDSGTSVTNTFKIYFSANDLDTRKELIVGAEQTETILVVEEGPDIVESYFAEQTFPITIRNLDRANLFHLIRHFTTRWWYNLLSYFHKQSQDSDNEEFEEEGNIEQAAEAIETADMAVETAQEAVESAAAAVQIAVDAAETADSETAAETAEAAGAAISAAEEAADAAEKAADAAQGKNTQSFTAEATAIAAEATAKVAEATAYAAEATAAAAEAEAKIAMMESGESNSGEAEQKIMTQIKDEQILAAENANAAADAAAAEAQIAAEAAAGAQASAGGGAAEAAGAAAEAAETAAKAADEAAESASELAGGGSIAQEETEASSGSSKIYLWFDLRLVYVQYIKPL